MGRFAFGRASEAIERRVNFVNDEPYLFEFSVEKKWKRFLITSPDTENADARLYRTRQRNRKVVE
jgi:hypothetical protein